jgi:hypothetical protein
MRSCLLILSVLSCLLILSCAKTARVNTVASNEPDVVTANLFGAHDGWPMDTAGGLYATGLSTPADPSMTEEKLAGQAKAGALARIFAQLRQKGLGAGKAEIDFFGCAEERATEAYVLTRKLPNTRMEVGVFFNPQTAKLLEECLGK